MKYTYLTHVAGENEEGEDLRVRRYPHPIFFVETMRADIILLAMSSKQASLANSPRQNSADTRVGEFFEHFIILLHNCL